MTDVTKDGKPAITAEDLDLIDPALTDSLTTSEEMWNEFQAADAAATAEPAGEATQPDEAAAAAHDASDAKPTPAAAAEPAKPDIWANATPEQRAAFDEAQQARARAEQQSRSDAGRQSALARRVNELQKQLQPRPAGAAAKPKDALAGIAQDYPEIAEPLTKALEPMADRMEQDDQSRRRAAQDELSEIVEEQTNLLLGKHADYEDVLTKNQAAFAIWVEDQPKRIRDAAYRNAKYIQDGHGAIEVLDAFKASLSPQPATVPAQAQTPIPLNDRRQRQLEGTVSPRGKGGRPTVSGIPEDGDPETIWAAFDAQERARA